MLCPDLSSSSRINEGDSLRREPASMSRQQQERQLAGQQPTHWKNAAQIASTPQYGRILRPGLNKGIRISEKAIMAPLMNPVAYTMKRNLNASALTKVVMTPTASVMGRDTGDGHIDSQGIISSRRQINSEEGHTLVAKEHTRPIYLTDMGITPQAEDR